MVQGLQADGIPPTIFLIDFSLAQHFWNPSTYLHICLTANYLIIGTLVFTSVNGQQGYTQSCHDDLESLTYTIIYLVRGDLPWAHLSTLGDHKAVLQKKAQITVEELSEGLPTPFYRFIIHIHLLGFDQKPDYQHLCSVLSQCLGTKINQPGKVLLFAASPSLSVNCTPVPGDHV